jgi:phage-related holin
MLAKLKLLAVALLAVFAPIQSVLLTALTLVLADLITGILASRHRGEKITSAGLQRTVVKLLVYMAVIMLGFLTETYLTGSTVAICKIISSYVGLTELTSIMENLNEISGGSLLKSLISKLGSQNKDDSQ